MATAIRQLAAAITLAAALALASCGATPPPAAAIRANAPATPTTPPTCSTQTRPQGQTQINQYVASQQAPRQLYDQQGKPAGVQLTIPPITFRGQGSSTTLPVGPCQHIYRYAYPPVRTRSGTPNPFVYVEIDWNTEGAPRGPNGSFRSAHFDFHYYLKPERWVDAHTMCPTIPHKPICDPSRTPYEQMQRFLRLPPAQTIPPRYYPDIDSSIPEMGLHLLDGKPTYTTPYVDHHPTLIYGTYNGRILFAEASVTLATFKDATKTPTGTSFPFRQPSRVQDNAPWPDRLTINHNANGTFTIDLKRTR